MGIVSFTMSLLHLIVAAWRHLISAFKSISHSFSTSPSASATSRTRVERHLPEWTWAQVQQPRTATALAGANRAYPSTLESVLVSPSPDRIYATPTERPAVAAQPNATSVINSQGRSQIYNPPAISKGALAPSASRSRSPSSSARIAPKSVQSLIISPFGPPPGDYVKLVAERKRVSRTARPSKYQPPPASPPSPTPRPSSATTAPKVLDTRGASQQQEQNKNKNQQGDGVALRRTRTSTSGRSSTRTNSRHGQVFDLQEGFDPFDPALALLRLDFLESEGVSACTATTAAAAAASTSIHTPPPVPMPTSTTHLKSLDVNPTTIMHRPFSTNYPATSVGVGTVAGPGSSNPRPLSVPVSPSKTNAKAIDSSPKKPLVKGDLIAFSPPPSPAPAATPFPNEYDGTEEKSRKTEIPPRAQAEQSLSGIIAAAGLPGLVSIANPSACTNAILASMSAGKKTEPGPGSGDLATRRGFKGAPLSTGNVAATVSPNTSPTTTTPGRRSNFFSFSDAFNFSKSSSPSAAAASTSQTAPATFPGHGFSNAQGSFLREREKGKSASAKPTDGRPLSLSSNGLIPTPSMSATLPSSGASAPSAPASTPVSASISSNSNNFNSHSGTNRALPSPRSPLFASMAANLLQHASSSHSSLQPKSKDRDREREREREKERDAAPELLVRLQDAYMDADPFAKDSEAFYVPEELFELNMRGTAVVARPRRQPHSPVCRVGASSSLALGSRASVAGEAGSPAAMGIFQTNENPTKIGGNTSGDDKDASIQNSRNNTPAPLPATTTIAIPNADIVSNVTATAANTMLCGSAASLNLAALPISVASNNSDSQIALAIGSSWRSNIDPYDFSIYLEMGKLGRREMSIKRRRSSGGEIGREKKEEGKEVDPRVGEERDEGVEGAKEKQLGGRTPAQNDPQQQAPTITTLVSSNLPTDAYFKSPLGPKTQQRASEQVNTSADKKKAVQHGEKKRRRATTAAGRRLMDMKTTIYDLSICDLDLSSLAASNGPTGPARWIEESGIEKPCGAISMSLNESRDLTGMKELGNLVEAALEEMLGEEKKYLYALELKGKSRIDERDSRSIEEEEAFERAGDEPVQHEESIVTKKGAEKEESQTRVSAEIRKPTFDPIALEQQISKFASQPGQRTDNGVSEVNGATATTPSSTSTSPKSRGSIASTITPAKMRLRVMSMILSPNENESTLAGDVNAETGGSTRSEATDVGFECAQVEAQYVGKLAEENPKKVNPLSISLPQCDIPPIPTVNSGLVPGERGRERRHHHRTQDRENNREKLDGRGHHIQNYGTKPKPKRSNKLHGSHHRHFPSISSHPPNLSPSSSDDTINTNLRFTPSSGRSLVVTNTNIPSSSKSNSNSKSNSGIDRSHPGSGLGSRSVPRSKTTSRTVVQRQGGLNEAGAARVGMGVVRPLRLVHKNVGAVPPLPASSGTPIPTRTHYRYHHRHHNSSTSHRSASGERTVTVGNTSTKTAPSTPPPFSIANYQIKTSERKRFYKPLPFNLSTTNSKSTTGSELYDDTLFDSYYTSEVASPVLVRRSYSPLSPSHPQSTIVATASKNENKKTSSPASLFQSQPQSHGSGAKGRGHARDSFGTGANVSGSRSAPATSLIPPFCLRPGYYQLHLTPIIPPQVFIDEKARVKENKTGATITSGTNEVCSAAVPRLFIAEKQRTRGIRTRNDDDWKRGATGTNLVVNGGGFEVNDIGMFAESDDDWRARSTFPDEPRVSSNRSSEPQRGLDDDPFVVSFPNEATVVLSKHNNRSSIRRASSSSLKIDDYDNIFGAGRRGSNSSVDERDVGLGREDFSSQLRALRGESQDGAGEGTGDRDKSKIDWDTLERLGLAFLHGSGSESDVSVIKEVRSSNQKEML